MVNVPAMKWILCAALASSLFLSACAHDELANDSSTSTAPVPGEKTGEGSVEPGMAPGGASANVRW
jgi:ABC-type oligopeptide transport system substrate-binding subunit